VRQFLFQLFHKNRAGLAWNGAQACDSGAGRYFRKLVLLAALAVFRINTSSLIGPTPPVNINHKYGDISLENIHQGYGQVAACYAQPARRQGKIFGGV